MSRSIKRTVLIFTILLGLALLWRYLIDSGYMSEAALLNYGHRIQHYEYSFVGLISVALLYVIMLAMMFPLTLLVVTTGLVFHTEWAMLCAVLGSLSSSATGYVMGHWVGRDTIVKHGGTMVRRAERYIQNNSFRSMVVINLLPIAPFTVTNMLAGAFKMEFRRYILGSAVGLIPGLILVIAFGGQLGKLLVPAAGDQPWTAILIAISLLGLLIGFLVWLDRRLKR